MGHLLIVIVAQSTAAKPKAVSVYFTSKQILLFGSPGPYIIIYSTITVVEIALCPTKSGEHVKRKLQNTAIL